MPALNCHKDIDQCRAIKIKEIFVRILTAAGQYPLGSLMPASNGLLYGMTNQGGANNLGVIFSFDPANPTYPAS